MAQIDRLLLHVSAGRRVPIEPAKVKYLEADGDETVVRQRGARVLRDVRSLGKVLPAFAGHGFPRVHRNHAVNLKMIRETKT